MNDFHPRSLAIDALSVRGFRNLAQVDLRLGRRFNVVSGDNGQGKTNLLEAVYAVLTSKSFRASKPGELVAHDGDTASVRARIEEDGSYREQSLGVRAGARLARIDGKRPKTLAAYAVASPVVLFHPGVLSLSMAGGAERRRLLDRVALYARPGHLAELESYEKALRARQRILEARGESARDLAEWEELLVRHGLAVTEAREEAASRLDDASRFAFHGIAKEGATFEALYVAGSPKDEHEYRARLVERRTVDLRRGSATTGPQRDDLLLRMNGRPVRGIASQGQHRAVVLSLKLGEIAVIERTRNIRPILLLDDVSSELDRDRTAALFQALRQHVGQVILTTTRPELIAIDALTAGEERLDFAVEAGVVRALVNAHENLPRT